MMKVRQTRFFVFVVLCAEHIMGRSQRTSFHSRHPIPTPKKPTNPPVLQISLTYDSPTQKHQQSPIIRNALFCTVLPSFYLGNVYSAHSLVFTSLSLSLSIHSSYLTVQPATTAIKFRCCSVGRQRADDPIPKDLSDDQWHADRRPMTTTRCIS